MSVPVSGSPLPDRPADSTPPLPLSPVSDPGELPDLVLPVGGALQERRTSQERERQLDLIERIAGLGSWEIDLTTGFIRWSREQCRIHGVDDVSAPGTHDDFRRMVHPDDLRVVDEGMSALLPDEPATAEFRIIRPDGQVRLLQAHAILVQGLDGRYTRVLGTSLDITERRATEDALRASEENYRLMFQYALDAMWVHDIDTGALLDVNEAAVEMFGYSADEQRQMGMAGLTATDLGYTEERAWEYARLAMQGMPQRFEWMGYRKDGTLIWEEMLLRRVTLGGVDRLLASARDITARKASEQAQRRLNEELERRVEERTLALAQEVAERTQAQEALRRQEEHFRRIIENSNDQVFIFDTTGAVTYVSPSVERLLGHTAEEMMGLRPVDIIHPDDVPHVMETVARVAANPGQMIADQYRIRHKDGSWRLFEGLGRTLSPHDASEGLIANARDITERVAVERALRDRDERFRRIIENASDFVMTCDATAALTYVAPSSMRMLGYRPEEILGTRPADLLHPDDVPNTMRDLQWLAEHPGESITTTFRIRHKDGSYRVFENVGRTISTTSMDEGVIAFGRDITDRARADEALAHAKDEAERANRAKSEFLSRMSHELRTPLNSILGFAQLLTRGELAAPQAKGVQHILKAGRHLLHLINEVLEISRIEAGRERFSLEPVALAPVLHETLGLVRPMAQQHHVELREGDWHGDAFVHADRQRLVQVMLNLLSNAIKYNRPGGYVRVSCVGQDEGRWALRVEDNGHGIPADRIDQLFTPFARLGAEQTEVEGTGLGLALSQRLCEAMGGALRLESTSAQGSTFRVELDRAHDPVRGLEDTGTYRAVDPAHGEATLLYIEDNLANLSLVETILLARPGWRTIPALQGQLGVELAREHVPDVILLDLHLPDIPGEEVLRRLRADPRTAAIPVVVVSADATRSSLDRLHAAGADAYLTKPIDVDGFLRVVERHLPGGAR